VSADPAADVGIFGGSGFYAFLDDVEEITVDTPYGAPSGPFHLGDVDGRRIAFLPRHGPAHEFPPHRVNYRANLWAMRALGVTRVIGPFAAGSLQPDVHPGDFVVVDQFVDRTWGRPDTFYDGPVPYHPTAADPYCPEVSALAVKAAADLGVRVHPTGTVVVVQGPRFSTRAESRWYRAQGWEVVNMTQYPEAFLARELGLCYTGIALITDYDTGVDDDPNVEPVTQEAVFAFFEHNVERIRNLLFELVPRLPDARGCQCADALGPLSAEHRSD
jgi:5'-methylthioadenosine phosphorylase